MPLNEGAKPGSKEFGENIATEVKAGKPVKQAAAIAYREARADMSEGKFDELKRLLDEFFSEEEREPEHKKVDAKLDAIAARADALQPNPWANKIAALNGGIESLTARLASKNDSDDKKELERKIRILKHHIDLELRYTGKPTKNTFEMQKEIDELRQQIK